MHKTPYLNSCAAILNFIYGQEGHLEFKMASFLFRYPIHVSKEIFSDPPIWNFAILDYINDPIIIYITIWII